MSTILQRSFAGGEIAPSVYARADMVKYATGLRTCRNFVVRRHGGVENRAGTKFLGEKKFNLNADNIRIEPFTYIATGGQQSKFILEFGHNTMRVWFNDAHVADGARTITGATAANPVVITSTAHGLSNGNTVHIRDVVGMTEVNDSDFTIANVTANTFELSGIDGTAYTAYASGGVAISSNVISRSITAATAANPVVVTSTAHGLSGGDVVSISGVSGMTELNGRDFLVASATANTFALQDLRASNINGTGYTTYVSGGVALEVFVLSTGITSSQISEMQLIQNGNALYVTHPGFAPKKIIATGVNSWEIETVSIGSDISAPTNVANTGYVGGTGIRYVVTTIDSDTLEESDISSETEFGPQADDILSQRIAQRLNAGAVGSLNLSVEVNGKVVITSTLAETLTFVVSGTYTDGTVSTEVISMAAETTKTGTVDWWWVNQVTVSGASAGVIDIGTATDADLIVQTRTALGAEFLNEFSDWQSGSITESRPGVTATSGRKISLFVTADESASIFTITGTDSDGNTISEDITGPASVGGRAVSAKFFTSVTLVTIDVATANTFTIGVSTSELYPVDISWTAVEGALEYNVYKSTTGIFGLVGVTTGSIFRDDDITADVADSPPITDDPFSVVNDYPSVVSVFQQRLWLANTNNNPTVVHASRIGFLENFNYRRPLQDDDALEFSIIQREYGVIRHLVDLGKLVVFTQTGEFVLNGDAAGAVTPLDVNTSQQGHYGSSSVPPIIIGGNAIFLQQGGRIVRDLGFDFATDGYRGNDLTVFAAHLFDLNSVTQMSYQQTPNSILWAVRSDGTLLGLTYLPEHQIWGWHRHDFSLGSAVDIATLQEGNEDFLYVVVQRTLEDGTTRKYVEKMTSRNVLNIEDYILMDSTLTYDGYSGDGKTMTLSGGAWTSTDTITMTASSPFFASTDVGKELHVSISGRSITATTQASPVVITSAAHGFVAGEKITIDGVVGMIELNDRVFIVANPTTNKFELANEDGTSYGGYVSGGTVSGDRDVTTVKVSIDAFTSSTIVTGKPDQTVPAGLRATAVSSDNWALAIDTVTGLWHLEGALVSVFGDGLVEASPNNENFPRYRVANGSVSLSEFYAKIHVGLPITSDMQTLDIDNGNGETLSDKRKLVTKATLLVEKTRGMFVGGNVPPGNDPLDGLDEIKARNLENYDAPVDLATGAAEVSIVPEWNSNGRLFVRQVDPVPVTVLGVAPSVVTAFDGFRRGQ